MSRFQFVADHRDTFEVKQLCETVEINRSSYYAWENAAPGRAERAAADAALAERIEVFHKADKAKLATEREILRSAAKYFAGETNW